MPLPTKVSDSFRRLNPHLFGATAGAHSIEAAAPQGAKRIRQQSGDGMNKWEREFRDLLVGRYPHVYREISLPLANGLRYKLDFAGVRRIGEFWAVEGFEVKGMARAAGIAKVKMAARLYPWIAFTLVTKAKKRDGGGWREERVLP